MGLSVRAKQVVKSATGGLPFTIDEPLIVFDAYGKKPGVMLDVGAHYGDSLAPFAKAGWTVHAFEPDPTNLAKLVEGHEGETGVTIVPKGVSSEPGSLPLYTSEESAGISSLAPFTPGHKATSTVEIVTLRDYVAEAGITHIDFLKIDVEGFEKHVLDGHDWSIKPDTIVLEFEDSKTVPLGHTWTDLADFLVERGYSVVISEWDPIVNYGVAHKWRSFADYPAPLQNSEGWGNLIATVLDRAPLDRALKRAKLRQTAKNLGSRPSRD
jgi:FkbM family methyltransferase